MSGFFGVASKDDCVFDLFYGIDYHSHLGTRRGGMVVYGEDGFDRAIHNIENAPFRTKFDKDVQKMKGYYGIGCAKKSQAEIADELGVSHQAVSKILNRIINNLRKALVE